MTLRKIDRSRSPLADRVYEQLASAMLEGTISRGQRLIQDRLADELDVSRTPVREALLRLQAEGVIEPADRRGFIVREIGEEEVRALYQAREVVEGHAARLVSEAGAEAVAHVEAAVGEAERIPIIDATSSFRANRLVHRSIVEATGNPFMLEMFEGIWGRSVALRAYADLYQTGAQHSNVAEDHAALLDALRAGGPDRAMAAMVDHIGEGQALHRREKRTQASSP